MGWGRLDRQAAWRIPPQGVTAVSEFFKPVIERSTARRLGRFFLLIVSGLCDHRIGLDFDLDSGSFFELNFVTLIIGQAVWNSNLSIKMIRALNDDLGFLGLTGVGDRLDDFFDFCWECSSSL
jgi:hypothetical protein